jgi:predicted transcriptional regulator of viral defense system
MLAYATRMDKKDTYINRSLPAFVNDLQAKGRYTFARADAAKLMAITDLALEAALRRLKKRGRIANPRRGFYVIIPLEYREAGCPPASWFIRDLMQFLGQPYYVGLLSAAAIHGAAHQQPMVFQVITDRATRRVRAGRVSIHFHISGRIEKVPVVDLQTETGSMRVSTPEATAFDLVRFAAAAGHVNNVATVLSELSEKLAPAALAKLAGSYAIPEVQRIGYLLEKLGEHELSRPLAGWLAKRRYRPIPLVPGKSVGKIAADPKWRVFPNERVEVDL